MHVDHLSLVDYRSYAEAEVPLGPGVTVFVGRNGQGKTNLVEALGYLATLDSHRVALDAPLVRVGAERAVVRAGVQGEGRRMLLELEISPGAANRGRLNGSPLPRTRELLGVLRTVLFAPEDLALVKGDPSERRRFLDELLTVRSPRLSGVRADVDRVLKQRNALLKSMRSSARGRRAVPDEHAAATLDVWDDQLADFGGELLRARLALVEELRPQVAAAYAQVAPDSGEAALAYKASWAEGDASSWPDRDAAALREALKEALLRARSDEIERGATLVGPQRDDLLLTLGGLPAKGYASHGESWSFALALRLASYWLLRDDERAGGDPVLILDDVFAELDTARRDRLAELVAGAEQVLITAAVADDVPARLAGARFEVTKGRVEPV
jgi:DNA replication and repair protein RecF